jgi:hypothetical protein
MHMHRHTIFMDDRHLRQLQALGKTRGLKVASMIRLSIAELLRRETARDARAAKQSAQGE